MSKLQETAALNAAAAHLSKRQRNPNISSESPYMSSLPSPYYGVTENQSIPSWPTPKTSRENSPGSSAVQGPATPPFAAEEGAVSDIRCVPSSSNASHFSVLSDGGGGSMQGGATDGGDSGAPVQYVRTHYPYGDQYPKFEEVPLEQAQDVPQGNSSAHPFSYSPTVASRRSVHMAPFQPRSFVPSTERFQAAMPEPGSMPRGYETPWVPSGDAANRASGMSFESGRHRGGQLNRLVQMERAFRMNRKRTQTFAGPLFALDGDTGQWKKRHFRVNDGVISYTQAYSQGEEAETVSIQLYSSACLEVIEWPKFGRKCLKLTPREGDLPYLLSAISERDQEGWVRTLEEQGVSILRNGETNLLKELSGISLW